MKSITATKHITTLQAVKQAGGFTATIPELDTMARRIRDNPARVYEIMQEYGTAYGVDSYTRETIFQYIADEYHAGDYGIVYDAWLAEEVTG